MDASLVEILRHAQALSPGDKIDLAMALLAQARGSIVRGPAPAKWADIRGSIPYPMFGDDGQSAINRLRDEWDDNRFLLRQVATDYVIGAISLWKSLHTV